MFLSSTSISQKNVSFRILVKGVKMRYNRFLGGRGVLSSWKQSIWIPRPSINMFHCANMLMLGGLRACPLEKFRCSAIESEAILESKYMHVISRF